MGDANLDLRIANSAYWAFMEFHGVFCYMMIDLCRNNKIVDIPKSANLWFQSGAFQCPKHDLGDIVRNRIHYSKVIDISENSCDNAAIIC